MDNDFPSFQLIVDGRTFNVSACILVHHSYVCRALLSKPKRSTFKLCNKNPDEINALLSVLNLEDTLNGKPSYCVNLILLEAVQDYCRNSSLSVEVERSEKLKISSSSSEQLDMYFVTFINSTYENSFVYSLAFIIVLCLWLRADDRQCRLKAELFLIDLKECSVH